MAAGRGQSQTHSWALIYFCNPEDLIPDHIPGLRFLDSAIYVELVIRKLRNEVESYEEFSEYRVAEEARRRVWRPARIEFAIPSFQNLAL
jgi:uncharacterized membrane protein YkvA (DUF1232 family)